VQELKLKLKTFIQTNQVILGLSQPGFTSKLYTIFKEYNQFLD
jgi:hypothetical protein